MKRAWKYLRVQFARALRMLPPYQRKATMLDALCPAFDALKEGIEAGEELKDALTKAVKAAEDGVEYTKTIKATKGRASYIGDRSIGHQDPGATSAFYMLETLLANI